MKIALFKLGLGINLNEGYDAVNFEVLGTIEILKRSGFDVDCFTTSRHAELNQTKYNVYPYQQFLNTKDQYDRVVVVNGTLHIENDDRATNILDILNCFHHWQKPLIYFVYDPDLINLDTMDIPSILERETNIRNEINYNLQNNIDYVTLCNNPFHLSKFLYNAKNVKYLPLERFGTLILRDTFTIDRKNCEYDLTYFGSFKGGRRKDLMEKYFYDLPEDISLAVTGRIDHSNFPEMDGKRLPTYLSPIPYDQVRYESQKGWATIIITDKFYRDVDDIPPRVYECAQYGQIVFIDTDCDRSRRVYRNVNNQWLYISSQEELVEKVRMLKTLSDEEFQKRLDSQNKELLEFDEQQFYIDLNTTINMFG